MDERSKHVENDIEKMSDKEGDYQHDKSADRRTADRSENIHDLRYDRRCKSEREYTRIGSEV